MNAKNKFSLGQIVSTPGALAAIYPGDIMAALARHSAGDWGDFLPEDAKINDEAIYTGGRILSVYTYSGVKFWIITEADRSVTTILLPEEY